MTPRETAINKKTKNKKKCSFFEIFKKMLFWMLFLVFFVATFWTIIFSPVMKIGEIEILGANEDKVKILAIIKKDIVGKYFDFIPRNNLLTFPINKIETEISNEFVMVRNVKIEREFPTKIVLKIEKRRDPIIWCSNENCWLVDETAAAFAKIEKPYEIIAESDILVTDGSGKDVEKGDRVAHVEIIEIASNLSRIISENSGIEAEKKSIYIPASVSGEIRIKTKESWEIYFSTARPILGQVEILKKILASKITLEDLAQLEYVDLRLKGKVVYRFRDYKEREKEVEEIEVMGDSSERTQKTKVVQDEEKDETKKDKKKKKED
jgi:cell division septal protein FtsQ